jgi:uncharacterized protein YndB with AHSA1/START domain
MAFDEIAVVRVRLDASAEAVWAALTEAEALRSWYWPASLRPRVHSDPVVGGRFGIEADGVGFSGDYVELERPRRIVQRWRWGGDDRDSRVTLELVPEGDGTELTVTHDGVDADTAVRYKQGWETCLARLPGYLSVAGYLSGGPSGNR